MLDVAVIQRNLDVNEGLAARAGRSNAGLPDARLIAACDAARDAMGAFDEGVKRNASFAVLCELLEHERSAVKAVLLLRSGTPRGMAEKATLLDCIANAGGREGRKRELYEITLSLAADAILLAKAMPAAATIRTSRRM